MGISPLFPCACREKQHFKVEFLFQFSFLHYSRIAFVELSFFLLSSYSCLFLQCLVKQLLQSCFICLSLMTFGEFWVIGIGRTVPRFWKHESLSAYQSYNCKEGYDPRSRSSHMACKVKVHSCLAVGGYFRHGRACPPPPSTFRTGVALYGVPQ